MAAPPLPLRSIPCAPAAAFSSTTSWPRASISRSAFPGESYLAVLDALYDVRERLRLIVCRHEGGAAYMGEAYGKLTGRPGIVFVTRGPGASQCRHRHPYRAAGLHAADRVRRPGRQRFPRPRSLSGDRLRRMYGGIAKWVSADRPCRAHSRIRRARVPCRAVGPAAVRSCSRFPRTCSSRPRRRRRRAARRTGRTSRRRSSKSRCCARCSRARNARWSSSAVPAGQQPRAPTCDASSRINALPVGERVSQPGRDRQRASQLCRRRRHRDQSQARGARARRRRPAGHRRAPRRNDDRWLHAARAPVPQAVR